MSRIAGLDVARGVAILGTLGTNIWIFSHPGGMIGYLGSATTPGAGAAQVAVETVLQQLANGKFLGLLTIMFGIGLAIQQASATRRGRPWPGPYLWRAALLLLDGVINFVLVIEFDVLMGYAVTGAVVAVILARSPRVQALWLVVTAGLHVLLISFITWAIFTGHATRGGVTPAIAGARPNPYADGSWWDLVLLRIDNAATFRVEPVLIALGSIALFLLGALLHRAGLFTPERARLRRVLMVTGAVALAVDLALGLTDQRWIALTRWVIAPIVALGLLALVAALTQRRIGWGGRRMAELGRVALSGYILQNLIASFVFYGWGLGLNTLPPSYRLGVTVVAWIAIGMIICGLAYLWLRRFDRGPVEWLSALAYQRLSRLGRARTRVATVSGTARSRRRSSAATCQRQEAATGLPGGGFNSNRDMH